MNKSRPVATETVKSLDYTKNILQTIPNNDTMEVVTQTNAVKSPTDSLKATTLVYTVALVNCEIFERYLETFRIA